MRVYSSDNETACTQKIRRRTIRTTRTAETAVPNVQQLESSSYSISRGGVQQQGEHQHFYWAARTLCAHRSSVLAGAPEEAIPKPSSHTRQRFERAQAYSRYSSNRTSVGHKRKPPRTPSRQAGFDQERPNKDKARPFTSVRLCSTAKKAPGALKKRCKRERTQMRLRHEIVVKNAVASDQNDGYYCAVRSVKYVR